MSRKLTALLLAILMLPFSAMNTVAEGEPDLSINEISFSDDSPTGGDIVTITAEVANDGGSSGLVSVTTNVSFYWDDEYIGKDTITIPGSSATDAEMDWEAVGGTHTIKVIVDEENAIEESDEDNNEDSKEINVNYPPILFVDDDDSENNGGFSLETDPYYTNALENLSIGYDTFRVRSSEDGPDIDTLSEYVMIIWACGSDYASGDTDVTFTDNDKTNVADYLDNGGNMWVIGHDILYDFDYVDGERYEGDFEYDYFGISYVDHDRQTPSVTYGVEDDPISHGIAYDTDALSSDFADDIDPRDGFEKVLSSNGDYNISTIRTEEDYKLVFMAFDFSSITNTEDRDEFMEKIVEYLAVQLENDVSLSRFNNPKNKDTIEPGVDNTINVTVRNRGTTNQTDVEVYIDIQCRNDTDYRFMDDDTVSINAGEGAFVEFEWETPDDEDYEYDIKARAYISDDEKEDNNVKTIEVDTYVTYDVEVSEARVDPMIAEKDTEREMSVVVTNTGDMSMTSEISGKVYDGAGGVVYNGGTQDVELDPGESDTLDWEWETDEYGTFWFEAEVLDDSDEVPENDVSSTMMRSVDIEFSDNMESGRNGWTDYKSLSNPWHLIDTDEDSNREAASPTHAMWVGDESKGDGEYDNNWDFSLYTAQNISLSSGSPQMSVNLWYSVENSWDGGNVQISTDGGESWTVIEPDGGYPDDAIVGLDNEPGYTATSGDGDETSWEIASFDLTAYSSEDVKFRFRFGTDSSVNTYEGWYIDDFEVNNGATTIYEDDFEDGDGDWTTDVVLSEWNYYSKDEEYGKAYSGNYAWYLGNPETGAYGASLNDSLESPSIDLGDGSEKYVSAMVWFGIDGPYDKTTLEINISGEWETVTTFPGDDGDFSQDYNDADENGWVYLEADVSEYEGEDVSFRFRFESDTYTQYDGLYVDDFTLYSLPALADDVGTRSLDAPSTAKPGREVTFYSDIYNFGTDDQDEFDIRGKITRDDGTVVYNQTQTLDDLNSKDNITLDWTWEGGPEGTYTIRVETLLDGDERAGNNPKEEDIDIAESGYQVALAVQENAKDVLSGESVFFNFTATNTGENSGYYDITVDYSEQDEWRIISHLSSLYMTAGSSQNFTVVVIAPTLASTGDEHGFTVTVTSRDDPETEDSQGISATPFYNQQSGGDKVLLVDANFGKNNGYNNYYDIDEIDNRMKYALQQYFNDLEIDCESSTGSCGYDVHTIPYDKDAGYGELHPYPTINLMSEYDAVIWIQGDHHQRNLTNWKNCISDYLNASGNMWIMGQNFMSALNSSTGAREAGSFEYD
ncbi:MAG: CARDB domain-containing protein, partial [Candidatus Thermoplasmatota archaeon]|nr:CARDB domain-containing protein [Candidatus Thermoplasmatota archaeon]